MYQAPAFEDAKIHSTWTLWPAGKGERWVSSKDVTFSQALCPGPLAATEAVSAASFFLPSSSMNLAILFFFLCLSG